MASGTRQRTEEELELRFVRQLEELGWVYREDIRDGEGLEENFFQLLGARLQHQLTASERQRVLQQLVRADVFEASKLLRRPQELVLDDGSRRPYTLFRQDKWCENTFEVCHQVRLNTRNSQVRFDVVLLVNGLPLAQVELKAFGRSPKEAMKQIVGYKQEAESPYGRTLFCYVQLFIVSNGGSTYYFAHNNAEHFHFDAREEVLPWYQFADENNQKLTALTAFTDRLLPPCMFGEFMARYVVLEEVAHRLVLLRPYQIYAVRRIVERVVDNAGGGYIWHTTGSGKTLTSFKVSTLIRELPEVAKCVFVVDRKDLDVQTQQEFNRFQQNCVAPNASTQELVVRLASEDRDNKVIVTTIQKLGLALKQPESRRRLASLGQRRVVLIFDECHRSQFGEWHASIREFFPRAQLFGFTGTPIFAENSSTRAVGRASHVKPLTTGELFGAQLHAYTIKDAIADGTVLRFHIDYTRMVPKGWQDDQPQATDVAAPPKRKRDVVDYILRHHDALTRTRQYNALLATASIDDALEYYRLFAKVQAERQAALPGYRPLRVACLFTPPPGVSEVARELQEDTAQEQDDWRERVAEKQTGLEQAIMHYNAQYGCRFTLGEFEGYYCDVQARLRLQSRAMARGMQDKLVDVVIVVDMLLTGFNAPYLNTLYVDKPLRYHGLIQAFSRTNRVVNATKPFGNIVCFRALRAGVDEALRMFADSNVTLEQRIWVVPDPETKLMEAKESVQTLLDVLGMPAPHAGPPAWGMVADGAGRYTVSEGRAQMLLAEQVAQRVQNLKSEKAQDDFVAAFRKVQRDKMELSQYSDLTEAQRAEMDSLFPPRCMEALKGEYLRIYHARQQRKKQAATAVGPSWKDTPAEEEMAQEDFELALFSSIETTYDYLMELLATWTQEAQLELRRSEMIARLKESPDFQDDADLAAPFVDELMEQHRGYTKTEVDAAFEAFRRQRRTEALAAFAQAHGLDAQKLAAFVESTRRDGLIDIKTLETLLGLERMSIKERMAQSASQREFCRLLSRAMPEVQIRNLKNFQ